MKWDMLESLAAEWWAGLDDRKRKAAEGWLKYYPPPDGWPDSMVLWAYSCRNMSDFPR